MAITKVSPGLLDLDSGITITTADNTTQLTLISTDADANKGPVLDLYRNSSSPADADSTGRINFQGENSAGETITYSQIFSSILDVTDGTEDGRYKIGTMVAGSFDSRMDMTNTETIFNDDSKDLDFRVESNGNANMLFVDGGNNSVMIGGTALASGQRFAVNVTNADSSTNEPVVFNNETHSAANAYGILIKYSGSSGNWSSGTGQNFIRCTDNGESNQKFAVTGAGQVQAQTGIAFAGDTAAANTLDDYEEGTWTPVLTRNSAPNISYTIEEANYTKIGRMVTVQMGLLITGVTSQGGSVTSVTGLPFNNGGVAYSSTGSVGMNNAFASECHVCHIAGNANNAINFHADNISYANLQTDFTNGGRLYCSLTYEAA